MSTTFQNKKPVKCINIGSGVLMRKVDHVANVERFGTVWPRKYGSNLVRQINTQAPKYKEHLEALQSVIESIWPSTTKEKFIGLIGLGGRSPFHQRRLEILMEYLKYIWSVVVKDKVKHPFAEIATDLEASIISRVSYYQC